MERYHIYPWQIVVVLLLVGFLIWDRRRKRAAKGPQPSTPNSPRPAVSKVAETPETAYLRMRRQAIETDPLRLGLAGELGKDTVYGVLMEMGISKSTVTLACFADGDARVFYRTGGGMIGGISHESVRKVSKELIALAQEALPGLTKTSNYPLTGPDQIQFFLLTPRGIFTAETDREAVGSPESGLSALYYKGQAVVAEMREVQEQKSQESAPGPAPPAVPQ
jgi:hypothetical protein